jgi:hypothetical protein
MLEQRVTSLITEAKIAKAEKTRLLEEIKTIFRPTTQDYIFPTQLNRKKKKDKNSITIFTAADSGKADDFYKGRKKK